MIEERKKFQVIEGFRSTNKTMSRRFSEHLFLSRKRQGSTDPPPNEFGGNVLTSTLKATEQRLSGLLEDRRRIGRDLHDSVLQSLYAIGLNLETSLRMNPQQTPHTKRTNDQVVAQINRLIRDIRGMVRSLESGTVQEFNLASELSTLRETYEQVGRLQITLDLQPNAIEVLTKEEEREILNIVREALSNCVRHAKAAVVHVSIRMRGTRIKVSVGDDGIGFTMVNGQPRGYGLANMDDRAKRLGGTLLVQSKIGRGTQINVEFSLEPILVSV